MGLLSRLWPHTQRPQSTLKSSVPSVWSLRRKALQLARSCHISQVSPGGSKDCQGPGAATASMCSAFPRAARSTVSSYSPANLYQLGREVAHHRGETKHGTTGGGSTAWFRVGRQKGVLKSFLEQSKTYLVPWSVVCSGSQPFKNLSLAYWNFWPLLFERVVNLYKVGLSSRLAMKQIFPGFITEMFPTSSDRKHKIERFNRLTTVIMAVHNRVNPMNNVLYLAEVRQLVVSGSNKILLVSSDTYDF